MNCIICLEDLSNNNIYLHMPISTSDCSCIYDIHFKCLQRMIINVLYVLIKLEIK